MFGLFNNNNNRGYRGNFNLWQGNAIVTDAIHPHRRGRVKFRGSWWFARGVTDIDASPGVWVNVIGRDEMTLLVELPEGVELRKN